MKKIQIAKNTIQETLIVPLYARKIGRKHFSHILDDPYAEKIMQQLDYDFSHLDKKQDSLVYQFGALEGILRSRDILCEMEVYLAAHPYASVVNLGCGLDPTPLFGDNGKIKLYNIDRPDVIAIRNTVLPPMSREANIAADLNDDTWLEQIDASHGVFLFATGVFMYMEKKDVRRLFLRLKKAFPSGCLVFDTVNKFAVKILMKKTLENMDIYGVDGMFYSNQPTNDLKWADDTELSVRRYMTGYVDLKRVRIPPLLRWVAHFFDWAFKMNICKINWG